MKDIKNFFDILSISLDCADCPLKKCEFSSLEECSAYLQEEFERYYKRKYYLEFYETFDKLIYDEMRSYPGGSDSECVFTHIRLLLLKVIRNMTEE